jgi:hypothetical protein
LEEKDLEKDFSKKKDDFQSWCKTCHSTYFKKHYRKDIIGSRRNAAKRVNKLRLQTREVILDYLAEVGCEKCGCNETLALAPYIPNGSTVVSLLSRLIAGPSKIATTLILLESSVVLCANCVQVYRRTVYTTYSEILNNRHLKENEIRSKHCKKRISKGVNSLLSE